MPMVPLLGDFGGVFRLSGTVSDRSALTVQLQTGTHKRIQHHYLTVEVRSYFHSLQNVSPHVVLELAAVLLQLRPYEGKA